MNGTTKQLSPERPLKSITSFLKIFSDVTLFTENCVNFKILIKVKQNIKKYIYFNICYILIDELLFLSSCLSFYLFGF